LIAREVRTPGACDQIEPAPERVFASDKRFARENVVADRQIVVAELAIVVR
jgi:hypothetical protein